MYTLLIIFALIAAAAFFVYRKLFPSYTEPTVVTGKYAITNESSKNGDKPYYDVAIVGAGPSGATCAYYLAKAGRKVLLLEKKQFPRDKYCGDAVCKTAIEILMEMGIYDTLLKQNKAHIADSGGLCSPGGLSFVGKSKEILGVIPAAIAVKRTDLDEAIARCAQSAGADLKENHSVSTVSFSESTGLWTVNFDEPSSTTYNARVLILADGSPSRLGTEMGIVTEQPQGTCSRCFVKGGSHNLKSDGVVFYHKDLLPGYAALFRHPNDELNYCCYLIPGNPAVTNDTQKFWHDFLVTKDPNVSRALGKDAVFLEPMRAASLRLGGIEKSYAKHMLIIGDAAGMIDPLTGEGIHHAMEGGKIAAKFLAEVWNKGNFEEEVMQIYHMRWMKAFGFDFKWSMSICLFLYRFPILLDAATAAIQRKGDLFLARWADIMTGRVPKVHLLRPEFVVVITYELIVLIAKRLLGGGKPKEVSTVKKGQ